MTRKALVTGGNRGIGRAIAAGLAARGLDVVIGARDPQAGQEAAEALGVRALHLDVDVQCLERLEEDAALLGVELVGALDLRRQAPRLEVLAGHQLVEGTGAEVQRLLGELVTGAAPKSREKTLLEAVMLGAAEGCTGDRGHSTESVLRE